MKKTKRYAVTVELDSVEREDLRAMLRMYRERAETWRDAGSPDERVVRVAEIRLCRKLLASINKAKATL
jgi:hypothetical protein